MQLINPANAVLHRVGGLHLTTRFAEGQLPVIDGQDWKEGSAAVAISFSSDMELESTIVVREFVPRCGDVTGRRYTDDEGTIRWMSLPAYGLVRPEAYVELVRTQVPEQALLWAASKGFAHREALRLIHTGTAPELEVLLQYDFARYQKTSSSYITGPERLGIEALPPSVSILGGRVPLPRMITAQCDVILNMYLAELWDKMFGDPQAPLQKRILSTDIADTHVAYVALRILAEGTLWILVDKERRDCENNMTDNALQVQLQEDLGGIIGTFCDQRYGLGYKELVSGIPKDAHEFYKEMAREEIKSSVRAGHWSNALFWLPPLRTMGAKRYVRPDVFQPVS